MGCTFLAPGPLAPEEVIAGTRAGIYIRRMETASTDTRSGTARFVVTDADRIDRGRLGPPLREFLLEVHSATALASLDRVACDLAFDTCVGTCLRDGQPLVTSVGGPTFRLGVATVVC
jgi:TldD protein